MRIIGEESLQVRILSPTQVHYNGKAVAVSAVNAVGPFDILESHTNFFSLLVPCTVYITTKTQRYELVISQGIIKVRNNMVTLFIDIEPKAPEPASK